MSGLRWDRARNDRLRARGVVDRSEGFGPADPPRWVKHRGKWAVRASLDALIGPGSELEVVKRSGESTKVTVSELLEATERSQIWKVRRAWTAKNS